MQKIMALLISSLIMTLLSNFIYGVVTATEEITLQHTISKVSNIKISALSVTKFEDTNTVDIANISLKNNTRDGYSLHLRAGHGQLVPDNTHNGEEPISYILSTTPLSGTKPGASTSGFQQLSIPQKPTSQFNHLILGAENALSGADLLNTPTDINFTLRVNLETDAFIEMAGSYSDVIYITYSDH